MSVASDVLRHANHIWQLSLYLTLNQFALKNTANMAQKRSISSQNQSTQSKKAKLECQINKACLEGNTEKVVKLLDKLQKINSEPTQRTLPPRAAAKRTIENEAVKDTESNAKKTKIEEHADEKPVAKKYGLEIEANNETESNANKTRIEDNADEKTLAKKRDLDIEPVKDTETNAKKTKIEDDSVTESVAAEIVLEIEPIKEPESNAKKTKIEKDVDEKSVGKKGVFEIEPIKDTESNAKETKIDDEKTIAKKRFTTIEIVAHVVNWMISVIVK